MQHTRKHTQTHTHTHTHAHASGYPEPHVRALYRLYRGVLKKSPVRQSCPVQWALETAHCNTDLVARSPTTRHPSLWSLKHLHPSPSSTPPGEEHQEHVSKHFLLRFMTWMTLGEVNWAGCLVVFWWKTDNRVDRFTPRLWFRLQTKWIFWLIHTRTHTHRYTCTRTHIRRHTRQQTHTHRHAYAQIHTETHTGIASKAWCHLSPSRTNIPGEDEAWRRSAH